MSTETSHLPPRQGHYKTWTVDRTLDWTEMMPPTKTDQRDSGQEVLAQ